MEMSVEQVWGEGGCVVARVPRLLAADSDERLSLAFLGLTVCENAMGDANTTSEMQLALLESELPA